MTTSVSLFSTRVIECKCTCLAVPGAVAHHLQHQTPCKIQNDCQAGQEWSTYLQRGLPLGFWPLRSTFAQQFLLFEHSFYEKVDNRETGQIRKKGGKKIKRQAGTELCQARASLS